MAYDINNPNNSNNNQKIFIPLEEINNGLNNIHNSDKSLPRSQGVVSEGSIDSVPEISKQKELFLRSGLIIINVISLLLGFYILFHPSHYFPKNSKFEHTTSLHFFLILYSLGMIGSLILAFIISSGIKIFFQMKNGNKNNNNNQKGLIYCEENHSVDSFSNINNNINEIGIIPYTLTIFIVITIVIYFICLPYALCLFIDLVKDKLYCKVSDYGFLYIFIGVNAIAGGILVYILFVMIFAKRKGSLRKKNMDIDDNNIQKIRNEIKNAIQNAN